MLKKYQTLQFRVEVKVEAEGSYPDQGLAQIVPWAGCLSLGVWSGGAEAALWPWAGSGWPKSGAAGTFPSHTGSPKGHCGLRDIPLQRATRAARGGTAGRSEAPSPQPHRGAGASLPAGTLGRRASTPCCMHCYFQRVDDLGAAEKTQPGCALLSDRSCTQLRGGCSHGNARVTRTGAFSSQWLLAGNIWRYQSPLQPWVKLW